MMHSRCVAALLAPFLAATTIQCAYNDHWGEASSSTSEPEQASIKNYETKTQAVEASASSFRGYRPPPFIRVKLKPGVTIEQAFKAGVQALELELDNIAARGSSSIGRPVESIASKSILAQDDVLCAWTQKSARLGTLSRGAEKWDVFLNIELQMVRSKEASTAYWRATPHVWGERGVEKRVFLAQEFSEAEQSYDDIVLRISSIIDDT